MASWEKQFIYVPKYEFVSCNQHGDRFKHKKSTQLSCCKISADITDAGDLRQLILLSAHLDAPVRYDFQSNPQKAYIIVTSVEKLQEKT